MGDFRRRLESPSVWRDGKRHFVKRLVANERDGVWYGLLVPPPETMPV